MRWVCPLLALVLAGCITDVALDLDIRPSSAVPAEIVSWELRFLRLEGDERCPSADEAASAAPVGRLASVQTFEMEGVGIGEVFEGRWGFALLGRDVDCAVHMYGCSEIVIGEGVESPIVIEVDPLMTSSTCGCRTCGAGICSGDDVCE